ncbi:13.88 kDa late protein [Salmonella phage celemicas]|uniref:13.88 kDa late protein n=1 Tax=Salmonella phage celemicas TaxID=2713289 RepID=A0A6G8RQX6_9CAUD|nr:13.88 kDa late protein [Salmonella phage celemicas]EBR0181623.1 hypothetical protein [Salmonella enterica subsp. enterica serovar Enteritidis]EEL9368598.1 hypothetical protein [Salmonella enterica subsp. enterica serovar Enteritidis]QIO03854.1 13.88 kDa late protein [Salmonella phage celemicas]
MLEQFIKLFERFVVAHELIAANSAKQTVYQLKSDITAVNKELIEKSVSEMTVDVSVTGVETVKKELAKALEEVEKAKELPVEGEDIIDTKQSEAKEVLELAKEAAVKIAIESNKSQSKNKSGEIIEEPKRKPRKAKVAEPTPEPEEEVDYQSLRDQIQGIDDAIGAGPSDAACHDSDDLLEEFTGKKMKIAAIKDEDLVEYLERITAIKNKYFEEE